MDKDVRALLDEFFVRDDRFVSRHHLDSYDAFVEQGMVQTIRALNPIKKFRAPGLDVSMYVGGKNGDAITVRAPTATPQKCREDDLTYECEVVGDVHVVYETKPTVIEQTLKNVRLFRLPIMLRSTLCKLAGKDRAVRQAMGECKYDHGGYFVVDGLEKVVIAQTRNANNRLFAAPLDGSLQKYAQFDYRGWLRSAAGLFPKTIEFYRYASTAVNRKKRRVGAVCVRLPALSDYVPLFVLFRALGVESDREVFEHVLHDSALAEANQPLLDQMRSCVLEAQHVQSQEAALAALKDLTRNGNFYTQPGHEFDEVLTVLRDDVFPTAGGDFALKAHYLGAAVEKFVRTATGALPPENRDHMKHKRWDLSGMLVADLFRDLYTAFTVNAKSAIEAQYLYGPVKNTGEFLKLINASNTHVVFDHRIVTDGFARSLKGRWMRIVSPLDQKAEYLDGVSQDLSRVAYISTLSALRRVSTPMDPTSKAVAPHVLQASQWGYLCPCESPDGASIGLINHLALACRVTHSDAALDAATRALLLSQPGVRPLKGLSPAACAGHSRLLLNDVWLAVCDDPAALVQSLRGQRRSGGVSKTVSVCWSVVRGEVHVHSDGGRCQRPLKAVATGASLEYLDAEETETAMIAMHSADVVSGLTTHVELHPSLMFSVVAGNIPLPEHNQAPRNVLACAQTKQGLGVYATSYRARFDKAAYLLHYPQRSLVTTRASRFLDTEVLGYGQNVIVAIAAFTGYNMEDAIVINRSAVERGLLDASLFKTIFARESEDNDGPNTSIRVAFAKDGLPEAGAPVKAGDVLLARTRTTTTRFRDAQWDQETETVETDDDALFADKTIGRSVVDRVHVCNQKNSPLKTCKIRLREARPPTLGDKLSSRHGQKGVVGMIVPAENMPYTQTGLVPDIVFNPHGMPSRMTIAHLMEFVLSKFCCAAGAFVDGTPFNHCDAEAFAEQLERRFGLEKYGHEVLYDGRSGQQMESVVFMGPCYYQRLKHMTADKVNSRARGKLVSLTHQPTHGRGNGGGLRIGEMEANALLAHGAVSFMKESFAQRSDGAKFGLDAGGRLVAREQPHEAVVEVPYAFKMLANELEGMGMRVDLTTTPRTADSDGDSDSESDSDGQGSDGDQSERDASEDEG